MMRRWENGEKVWNELRKQGGFVYTAADGSKSVHFNRGKKPDRFLVALLAANREDLKLWIDEMHRRSDANWARHRPTSPLGMGPSNTKTSQESNRQGRDRCDCNGEMRFAISGGTEKMRSSGVLAVLIVAVSAVWGAPGGFWRVQAAESMVNSEIGRVGAPGVVSAGGPVDLGHVFSSQQFLGRGVRVRQGKNKNEVKV